MIKKKKKKLTKDSLGSPVVKTLSFRAVIHRTEFQSLVRELRSHMLHDRAKKKIKKIANLEKNLKNNKYT